MTRYAKVNELNEVIEFPYTITSAQRDYPNVSFSAVYPLSNFDNVYDVTENEKPIPGAGQIVVQGPFEWIDNQLHLTWIVRDMTELEIEKSTPMSVTMRQARLALLMSGKLADVNYIISQMPSPDKEAAEIEWEYASEVHRDSVLMQSLAPMLQLDDAGIRDLFNLAASL